MADAQNVAYRSDASLWNREQPCKVAPRVNIPMAEAATAGSDTNKDGIIVDPVGETKIYLRSGGKHYLFADILPVDEPYEDMLGKIVWGEDGQVYLKDIVSSFPAGSYVKGTLENGVITVEFPQLLAMVREDGEKMPYYADRVVKEGLSDFEATFVPDQTRTVSFTLNEDGSLEMEKSGGEWIIGLMNKNDEWLGYGDYDCTYTEYEENFVVAPEGLITEQYLFVADGSSHFVNVGFDNNDVYFQGIFASFQDKWVKGVIDSDNKITVANGQYLGFLEDFGVFAYFRNGVSYTTEDGTLSYRLDDNDAVLTYDPETRRISCADDAVLFANCALDYLYYNEMWRKPFMHIQPESYDLTPMDLWYTYWSPWDDVDHWCGIQFRLPALTVDSYYLDPDKIYWRMLVNDDVYMFDYDEYPQFDDLTEWVPYNSEGFEIRNSGSLHNVVLFRENIETITVESVYRADDGTSHYSNKVTYNVITGETILGIEDTAISATEVDSVAYYSLDGARVTAPGAGVYVKQVRMKDGRVSTCKVVRK